MPSFDSLHLCAHNPSGDLLWIGPNGAVSICECEETGGADEDDQTLLSFVRPSLPEDEEVAAVVSVGPFLWILTEEFQKKTHLSHRGVTIFAYHAVSGVCVGKKRTNLFGDTSASQPKAVEEYTCARCGSEFPGLRDAPNGGLDTESSDAERKKVATGAITTTMRLVI